MVIKCLLVTAIVAVAVGSTYGYDPKARLSAPDARKVLVDEADGASADVERSLETYFGEKVTESVTLEEKLGLRLILDLESARRDAFLKVVSAGIAILDAGADGNKKIMQYPQLVVARTLVRAFRDSIRATNARYLDAISVKDENLKEYLVYLDERLLKMATDEEKRAKVVLNEITVEDHIVASQFDILLSKKLMA